MKTLSLDLPYPVSVNRIWRGAGKHVYKSPQYKAWEKQATLLWIQARARIPLAERTFAGEYRLQIVLHPPDKRRRDLGNVEKVISDFLQHAGIVEDDCLCRQIALGYGTREDAPSGVRITVSTI